MKRGELDSVGTAVRWHNRVTPVSNATSLAGMAAGVSIQPFGIRELGVKLIYKGTPILFSGNN
jgi:hypothetical protein